MLKDLGIKGCVFDFDGTVVLTEHIHIMAWEYLAEVTGIPLPRKFLESVVGFSDRELIIKLSDLWQNRISAEEIYRIKHQFYMNRSQRVDDLHLVVGVEKALESFSRQCPIALATNSARVEVEPILIHFGIRSFFSEIHTIDSVMKPKPHPEIYQNACRSLGLNPEECVAFEDSTAGATAVRAAGLKLVTMTTFFSADKLGPAWRSIPDFESPVIRDFF